MPPFDFSSLTPKAQPTGELERSLWRQLSKADQEGNTALATKLANELKTLEGTPISGIRKRIAPIVDKVMSSPAGQALALPGLVAHQTMVDRLSISFSWAAMVKLKLKLGKCVERAIMRLY